MDLGEILNFKNLQSITTKKIIFPTEFIPLEIFEFPMEFFEGLDSIGNLKNFDKIYLWKIFLSESILFNIF